MAGKPKSKVSKRVQYAWTEEEILDILETVINKLLTEDDFLYTSFYIASQRLPKSTLGLWIKRSPMVADTHSMMRELSEAKIAQELLRSRHSEVSTIGGLFVLKAQYNWIEAQHRQATPYDTINDIIVEVGFGDDNEDQD